MVVVTSRGSALPLEVIVSDKVVTRVVKPGQPVFSDRVTNQILRLVDLGELFCREVTQSAVSEEFYTKVNEELDKTIEVQSEEDESNPVEVKISKRRKRGGTE